MRRLFTSLSRLSEDTLVISLAIVQPATWGVLWWRLVDNANRSGAAGVGGPAVAAAWLL